MDFVIGAIALTGFCLLIAWAVHFGNGLGKDIARYQIAKDRQYDLEARIRKLEENGS